MAKNIQKIKWNKGMDMQQWGMMRKEVEGIGNPNVVRIGASDVSVITGSNKYKCPQRLFYHLTGYHSSFFITEDTLAGHLAEATMAKRWEGLVVGDEMQSCNNALNGVKLRQLQKVNYFLLNKKYPHSFVSLDYTIKGEQFSPFTGDKYAQLTPVECKNTKKHVYKLWQDGCARQYYEQIQYQLALTETPVAILLVYLDGSYFKAKEIEANPEVQDYIMVKVNEFAEIVKIGKMALEGMKEAEASGNMEEYQAFHDIFQRVTPDPIGMTDNVELMQEIYDEAIDDEANVKKGDDQDELWMNGYLKCIRMEKVVESHKNLYKVKLLESCAEYEGITAGERKMTNRRATSTKKAYFQIR